MGWNTAACNVRFSCSFMDTDEGSNEIEGNGNNNSGSYGGWSESCPLGQAICGISVRYEDPNYFDDTALNDVEFYCCDD